MKLTLQNLEWDSIFFGYKIGSFVLEDSTTLNEIENIIDIAKKQNYKLIYCKSQTQTSYLSELINNHNILLADKKVTFGQEINLHEQSIDNIPAHNYTNPTINNKLLEITLQSGIFSRFAIDPNFVDNEFEKLYTEWIRKSVTGELAKEVWVTHNEHQEINGLITLGIKNQAADIGLLAIDTLSRGKKLGKTLVEKAIERAKAWGINKLQVVTQLDNINACNFYKKCGFQPKTIEYIYHIWI